jgi:hypothetical protein
VRTAAIILVAALLVVGAVRCNPAKGRAVPRWGITSPAADTADETKFAAAYRQLYELKFDSAQAAYQELARRLPKSAEAHLGLSMTYRYTNFPSEALAEAREALALDPDATGVLLNYADLILPIRAATVEGMSDAERYAESERSNLKAAGTPHPLSAHAHTGLWASYMAQGRLADARQQLRELGRRGYYQQPLVDLARNLLVGLEPDAILFTNGDNDTYPTWVVQVFDGFRPDVTVANLSLLNIPAVVKMMKDSLGLPVSLSDSAIAALAPKLGVDNNNVVLVSQQVVENIVANAAQAGRPVYFAVTVSQEMTDRYKERLVLEGLVRRVARDQPALTMDIDRITENMTKKYRLDWPEPLPAWTANMSPLTLRVAPLAMTYAAIDAQVAGYCDSLGNKAEAAAAFADAAEWAIRGGRSEAAREMLEGALEREPGNVRAKQLQARLDKANPTD